MKLPLIVFSLCGILISNILCAQSKMLDSLKAVLKTQSEDTAKVSTLFQIIGAWKQNNPDTIQYYNNQVMHISEKLGYEFGIANATSTNGYIQMIQGKFAESIITYRKSLSMFDQIIKNKNQIKYQIEYNRIIRHKANAYKNIGTATNALGNYDEALKSHISSLNLNKEINDKSGIGSSYQDIGSFYTYKGDYVNALKYLYMSLKIKEEMNDKSTAAIVYGSIANVYIYQSKYNEALENYKKCLEIQLGENNKRIAGDTYQNIANVYMRLKNDSAFLSNLSQAYKIFVETGHKRGIANYYLYLGGYYYNRISDYPASLENLLNGKEIAEEIGAKGLLIQYYNMIGEVYMEQKKYNETLIYFKQYKTLAKEMGSLEHMENGHFRMAVLDSILGNYKGAFENYKMHIVLRDSIFNEENNEKIVKMEMQYEFDKKESLAKADQEKKNAVVATQLKNNTTIRNYSLAALCLSIITAFLIFKQYRITKKSNKVIALQKQIAEEQRERAEESEKFKSRFLANMSHEIRTPMNAVLGMTNLLLKTDVDEQQHKYLDAVQKSSRNLIVIINDILDLSKIEARKMEFEKNPFRLADTLDIVYATLRFKAEEKGLHFNIHAATDIPAVLIGDAVRLSQVLINLGGNAIKFTEQGSVEISVIHLQQGNKKLHAMNCQLRFTVTDTGIGIPEDKISKVFEGFSQAETSTFRKYGGTGLGLNISKQLIEMQHGNITVESRLNTGTSFIFELPFSIGTESLHVSKTNIIDNAEIEKLCKLKILITEDNLFNQVVAMDTLQILFPGINVDIANNGNEAVEKVKASHYDLILMDVNMPDMNGLEATKIIRNELKLLSGKLKIMAMTASVTREEINICYSAGMDDYIQKPFEQDALMEKIIKIMST